MGEIANSASIPVVATGPDAPAPAVAPAIPTKFLKDGKPDYDALVKSYTELETRLASTKPADPPAPKPPEVPPVVPPVTPPATGFKAFEDEYAKNGKLSDDSYKALSEKTGMSKADIDSYIAYKQSTVTNFETEVTKEVGGVEGFQKLSQWASQNLAPAEVNAVNKLLQDTSNPEAAKIAVLGLKARMESVLGKNPTLISGAPATTGVVAFSNISEAKASLRDPRYRTDANYRAEHDRRMAASTFISV